MTALTETWGRIREANAAAGWEGWSLAQRDQLEALADDLNRDLKYPVVHAWRTRDGSQLQFWCVGCQALHVHGRHQGSSFVVWSHNAEKSAHPDSILTDRIWDAYVQRFADCSYNPDVPGGRGFCTCPVGSGDGHRVAHCSNEKSPYWRHGYVLHEVPANDIRACKGDNGGISRC